MSDPSAATPVTETLKRTALYDLHVSLGARMVPFAGYEMPVQYPLGVLKEHLHTRARAGLFDVSHMGQLKLHGPHAARALESLVPVDIIDLPAGQQRYALFTNDTGGLRDDLMVTNMGDHLFVVVNAGCKAEDTLHLRKHIGAQTEIIEMSEHALLALQGPAAVTVMQRLAPGIDFSAWIFMGTRSVAIGGIDCVVSRSGYTGEDGFEISVKARNAEALARLLLAQPETEPIGLGARDSLRLESGLCLYGHDIDTTTTPVEASLLWALSKVRRSGGPREGGFPGADIILGQIRDGVERKRVGLIGLDRTPVREGAALSDGDGTPIGRVTSGGFGPSAGGVVALGYVSTAYAAVDTPVYASVRGKLIPMRVAKTPFVPQRYYRGKI